MNNKKEDLLASGSIISTMLKLGIPTFVAQLINLLYNVVDRVYIGHIPGSGASALTGLGICFPIVTLVMAFASLAGAGGSPLCGISMGEGNKEKAEKIIGNAAFMLIAFSVILMAVFYAVKKPFLYMFGASDYTYPYADAYISIYLLGTIFVLISLGLNSFIIAQGNAGTAMVSVLIGAVCNIVLDPVFIFGLGMGVAGAAVATILSQCVSALWVIRFLTGEKATLHLRLKNMIPDIGLIKSITALGVSPFIMSVTESVITIAYNTGAQKYGNDLYVASITILQSVIQMIFTPLNGFTQGVLPLISYNFGAKNYDRVRAVAIRLVAISFGFSFMLSGLSIIFPARIAGIFSSEPELIELCREVLPIYIAGMLVFGAQSGCQTVFMSLGKAKQAFFFAILRKIILLTPLIIILPAAFNSVMGIYYAEPISDTISAICCLAVCVWTLRRIDMPMADKKAV